jgi:hypothetical protein
VAVTKTVTAAKPSVLRKSTLSKRPFSKSAVHVTIRKAGTKTVLGEGYVIGKKLRVWTPKGTKLAGKYTLNRTSGAKQLKRKATVTLGAKAATSKPSSK